MPQRPNQHEIDEAGRRLFRAAPTTVSAATPASPTASNPAETPDAETAAAEAPSK